MTAPSTSTSTPSDDVLQLFHPAVQQWFRGSFAGPTPVQIQSWPRIAGGANTLVLAPTGSGKTLAAFLVAINRLMFPSPLGAPSYDTNASHSAGVRTLYLSPLKALGVDVQRNLREPLAGVTAIAEREAADFHVPTIGVRSGDTPSSQRQRMTRQPPDILITTPESLYLLLTSKAREILATVESVIVDEIHSLVGTKRGSHLFLSLERLEAFRKVRDPGVRDLQRIGLSATQRPLEEVARLLGGATATADPGEPPPPRPVEIVVAGRRKQLDLRIEVPVEDMSDLTAGPPPSGASDAGQRLASIWPSIHPRLVQLIGEHRTTMIFVNSRRLAERLATAINELAGQEIAAAHHGSLAKDQRQLIEDRLKRGLLPAIVATSSLELGIDMGAVDLVIQIEAPPSIASGVQRVGRAGHQIDAPSSGVIFPKFRGDLLACSAAVPRMQAGEVEATYFPRNPLDVLAQQLVAMVALQPCTVDQLYATVRSAAPFAELSRTAMEGVLDLLSGRYPADEFSSLRPRVTWDRIRGVVSPRRGAQRIAIVNAGTIPDRGLYGVFLADGTGNSTSRVGELDEEMVFETKPGEVFLLGASAWRVLEITHDRVLVVPAPGEPGKMPFWHGDGPGRPAEFGRAIGALTRQLLAKTADRGRDQLVSEHGLDPRAASNLLDYVRAQWKATGEVPHDQMIVIESFVDEVGDWRVAVMTPFGARVHAPWATAVAVRLKQETAGEVDLMTSDDGMVFRLPESDAPPPADWFFPAAEEIQDIVLGALGGTALFAARFRENAARALLLPRRQPGRRTPLWLQRRKSADLLAVASRYERFPILLETYRECLRDVFDLPELKRILRDVEKRKIRVHCVQTPTASPFASSLLFHYTANYLYQGDAPLAERRAATLALDHGQLRELLGDAELRELLDREVVAQTELELQRMDAKYPLTGPDAIHDMLLVLGDLSFTELASRSTAARETVQAWVDQLLEARRILLVSIADQLRLVPVEDASRLRDALGVELASGLPAALLEPVADPLADLVSRYARSHVAFRAEDVARRLGIGVASIRRVLVRLVARERVVEGEFLPGGRGREWCDAEVLRRLKRRSLARLRKQIEPVDAAALARLLVHWQGLDQPLRGLDGLLDTIERLQGLPIPASDWESSVLPARLPDFQSADLDHLCAAGELLWRGCGRLGPHDGRIAFFLTDQWPLLAPALQEIEGDVEQKICQHLADRGASFFDSLHRSVGGFRQDVHDALWRLVWGGWITNDTMEPVRQLIANQRKAGRPNRRVGRAFRSRRSHRHSGTRGRWSLLPDNRSAAISSTERQTAVARQLLERYGIVTREAVASEGIVGGFAGLYPVFKAMEEAGRVRRGYFVEGQGAAQFAWPGADDRLREKPAPTIETFVLAATDPANPYGAALRWPNSANKKSQPRRTAGARVVLAQGQLIGYLLRGGEQLQTFLPENEPERGPLAESLARTLSELAEPGSSVCLALVDGQPVSSSAMAGPLQNHGFKSFSTGFVRHYEEHSQ